MTFNPTGIAEEDEITDKRNTPRKRKGWHSSNSKKGAKMVGIDERPKYQDSSWYFFRLKHLKDGT